MATNLWGNLHYGGISATGLLPGRDGESMSPVGFNEAPKYNNRMISRTNAVYCRAVVLILRNTVNHDQTVMNLFCRMAVKEH